ncbi:MAG: VacJ family lipoprotein [Gammaproteobacteria bacterium]|nr:VacJ family lipoprotein [Gammaproteobacteria bacterium]
MYIKSTLIGLLSWSILATPVYANQTDPYESFNRPIDEFNAGFDKHAFKPVAEGYVAITPDPARQAVHNFISNLFEPETIVNDLLQGKFSQAVQDTARFIFNSSFGLFGLIDIATPMGLAYHNEDLGQTLAVWGWKDSDYLALPFLGPSTVRDTSVKPIEILYLTSYGWPVNVLKLVDVRSNLLPLDPMLDSASDRYIFIRDSYLQQRQYRINDGVSDNKQKLNSFDFSD